MGFRNPYENYNTVELRMNVYSLFVTRSAKTGKNTARREAPALMTHESRPSNGHNHDQAYNGGQARLWSDREEPMIE